MARRMDGRVFRTRRCRRCKEAVGFFVYPAEPFEVVAPQLHFRPCQCGGAKQNWPVLWEALSAWASKNPKAWDLFLAFDMDMLDLADADVKG